MVLTCSLSWALDGHSDVLVEPKRAHGVITQNLGMVSGWKMSFAAIFGAVFVAVLDATVPLAAALAATIFAVGFGFLLKAGASMVRWVEAAAAMVTAAPHSVATVYPITLVSERR